jgi:protein-tyrosine-phosphatase
MAEGFLCAVARDQFIAANAAIESTNSDRLANEVMSEAGIDISGQRPLDVAQSLREHFGYVVTIFDAAKERSPIFPFTMNLMRWNIRDPGIAEESPEQRKESLQRVRDEINRHIREFVNEFAPRQDGHAAAA